MSNQNYEISLLRLLSEYVSKNKPFNIGEIKGAIALYELSVAQFVDEKPAISLTSYTDPFIAIQKSLFDDSTDETSAEETSDNDAEMSESSEESSSQKVAFTRWKQTFVDEVVNYSLDVINSRRHISQSALADLILKKFAGQISDDEKIVVGRSRPKFISKLHKNIYNNLILPKFVEFVNNEYHLVKRVYVKN